MGIRFEHVNYSYNAKSVTPQIGLNDFDLSLTEGKFIAVLGAPGSGKSTLLQHFNGLLLPQSGDIHILDFHIKAGDSAKGLGKLRKRVGLVFQFPEQQLFEDTVEKDIMFGPVNFGVPEDEAREAARRAVEALSLDAEILARNPFQLSSGQMRKAAIATILAAEPDVFVLDEPTASLDQASREELLLLLRRLSTEQGRTIIIVTHRLEEVLKYADEYVVLQQGEAVFHGTPAGLLERTDLLDAAGIQVPASVRFLREFCQRFGVTPPDGPLGAEEATAFVAESIKNKPM
ncbi:ATP-binding cassette domain-containing protein [Gorillibacterium massiliense]|uniref:ATP-binding cassette domain-containing protein n=1 Tax=Gorillibacterium massiliense TaxID=1280390 RepID=UPI000592E335|nr:ATP-binding cassette domain-containing protein [Gorillibacterium massiliense]